MAITKEEKQPPKNMVFLHKLRREIPPAGGKGQWVYSPDRRNCYFHADDLEANIRPNRNHTRSFVHVK